MFILFAKDDVPVKEVESKHCERCGEMTYQRLFFYYESVRIAGVFGWTVDRRFYYRCRQCSNTTPLPYGEGRGKVQRLPIPLRDRYGCLIFFVGIAVFLLSIWLLIWNRASEQPPKPDMDFFDRMRPP